MKNKMPLGLKLVLAFSIFGILWDLWNMSQGTYQFIVAVPKGSKGLGELITYAMWAAQLTWIISVFKRYKWGWKLFIATNAIIFLNVILIETIRGFVFESIAVLLTLILIVIMSLYVYRIRTYFNR